MRSCFNGIAGVTRDHCTCCNLLLQRMLLWIWKTEEMLRFVFLTLHIDGIQADNDAVICF